VLSVLIPTFDDAYTLPMCLASVLPVADEIILRDDGSTDGTTDIVHDAARAHPHVSVIEGRKRLGWIEARNALLAATDARHLLWLDADDVLTDDAGPAIARCMEQGGAAMLGLCEMWGDLDHTTQRLHHHDCCHVYIDRRATTGLRWGGGTAARPIGCAGLRALSGVQAFHLKGVKPDARIAARGTFRAWLRGKQAKRRGDVHAAAVHTLLHSRQDHLRGTYLVGSEAFRTDAPERPAVIRGHLPGRFRMVYRGSQAVDRTDSGVS